MSNKIEPINSEIKVRILQWFEMMRPGEICTMDQIHGHVLRHCKSKPSKKTIQNNVAQLKKSGHIKYQEKSYIQIVK